MITNFRLFEQKEQNWKLTLNISKIWKDSIYENANELTSFNDQYINFLNQQKDTIIQNTSEAAWTKLQELITRLNESKNDITESSSIWDDIYDWADANFVQIKAENDDLKKDF
jgi:hypothetical protein